MSNKRKCAEVDFETRKKRKEEIEKQIREIEKERESCVEADSELSSEEEIAPQYRLSDDDSDEILENPEDKEISQVEDTKQHSNEQEPVSEASEKSLNNSLKLALGEDPDESKAQRVLVHSTLIKRWKYYTTNGLNKDERTELLKKYAIPEDLTAPVLNEQIQAKLSEKSIKRDEYRYEVQKSTSAALTILSTAITMINDSDENGLDPDDFTNKLVDAARLMSDVQHRQTESRRAFIVPRFSKSFQDILRKTKPGQMLFGNDLNAKIKEFKDTDKLFENTTAQSQPKYQVMGRPSGNFKRPLEPKPPSNPNSYTGGQARPRLFFRGSGQRGRRRGQGPRPPMQPVMTLNSMKPKQQSQ